jgi:hypothetical protein
MHIRVAREDHPEVYEVIASQHCVERFRKRMGIKTPGIDAVAHELYMALQDADFTRWAPTWLDSPAQSELWALLDDDLAFPLTPTPQQGRWLAKTCLVRGMAR